MNKPKIIQIIPADKWLVIFEQSKKGEPGNIVEVRIIGWALLDNNNIRPIIPGEFDIINVLDQEMGDIVGYFHEDELDDMKDDIQNCARIVKETREEDHEEEQL